MVPTKFPSPLGFTRDGRIQYEDFLEAIGEDDENRHYQDRSVRCREPPLRDSVGNSVRDRLAATLRRAVDHGIDYRREIELQEGTAGGPATGAEMLEEGVVSRKRCGNRLTVVQDVRPMVRLCRPVAPSELCQAQLGSGVYRWLGPHGS